MLQDLNLEWNALGMWNHGITAIADGLSVNQTLEYLNLSNNQITHEGGSNLAMALKRNLTLMRWNNVGILGGRAFAYAMKSITSAVQRNVDCQSIYNEHKTVTQSLHREMSSIENEKSIQVQVVFYKKPGF